MKSMGLKRALLLRVANLALALALAPALATLAPACDDQSGNASPGEAGILDGSDGDGSDHDAVDAAPDATAVPDATAEHDATADQQPEAGFSLPMPTGPYGVVRGRRRTMVDVARMMDGSAVDAGPEGDASGAAGSGNPRALGVEVWYPSAPSMQGEPVPYLDGAEDAVVNPSIGNPMTHAHADLPFVDGLGPAPLILLSPCYACLPRWYTAYIEELVSHGYVVAAISHTLWTPVTTFADGSTIAGNRPPPAKESDAIAEAGIWLEDARFVLNQLEEANSQDPMGELTSHLDLAHVGILGHSFGGTTAVNILVEDSRVKAAFSLVGAVRGPAAGVATAKPFFMFDEGNWWPNKVFFAKATGDAYWAVLSGAGHLFYSDLPILAQEYGWTNSQLGSLDPEQGTNEVRAYLLAFFDLQLRAQSSPLLDGPSESCPDVTDYEKKP